MFVLDFLQRVLSAMPGAVSQGVLWGIMTLGVYLTFRILNVADMTVDGSFAAGGSLAAILIVKGMNPYFSLFFVFFMGLACGAATGFMTTKLKINILLASILTQIALYSINIRIMGKANTPMLGIDTMMTLFVRGFVHLVAIFKGIKNADDFEELFDYVVIDFGYHHCYDNNNCHILVFWDGIRFCNPCHRKQRKYGSGAWSEHRHH